MTEKAKEAVDKAKKLIKKAAGVVTPGDGENREYFRNLIKETSERSTEGLIQNLAKLRAAGLIDDDEFEAKKAKLLNRI